MIRRSAVLALLFAGAFSAAAWGETELTVQLTRISEQKAVFGSVESVDVTRARARIGGLVRELMVDEGSLVKRGQRLALVVDAKLELGLAALDARLASLAARRGLAETALKRARRLRRSGNVSQALLDEAVANLDALKADTAAQQAERAVLVQRGKEGAVLAPAAGRVLRAALTNGSVVMPGETLAEIAAERFVLRLRLPERHARFLKRGDSVRVGARGLGRADSAGRKGRVRQVYPELQAGRVVADVEVDGLGDFFVGERVRVWVSAGRRAAYVVPEDFLFDRYGLTYVRLKGVGEVVVQPGTRVAGGREVLAGLVEGDILVRP